MAGTLADDIFNCIFLNEASIGLDNGLAPNRRRAIIWTNADPIHWRIYAALRWDELTEMTEEKVLKTLKHVNILTPKKTLFYRQQEEPNNYNDVINQK